MQCGQSSAREGLGCAFGVFGATKKRPGFGKEVLGRPRQMQPASFPLEQAQPKLLLELSQLSREDRLADVQLCGCLGCRSGVGGGDEVADEP